MSAPKGVVSVLMDKDGRVIASSSDFERHGYGGFSLEESQRRRSRGILAQDMVRELCGPIIRQVVTSYDATEMMDALCRHHGFTVAVVTIGHDDPSQSGSPWTEIIAAARAALPVMSSLGWDRAALVDHQSEDDMIEATAAAEVYTALRDALERFDAQAGTPSCG